MFIINVIFPFFRQLNKQPRIKIHKNLIICYACYHLIFLTQNAMWRLDHKQQVHLFGNNEARTIQIFNNFQIGMNESNFIPSFKYVPIDQNTNTINTQNNNNFTQKTSINQKSTTTISTLSTQTSYAKPPLSTFQNTVLDPHDSKSSDSDTGDYQMVPEYSYHQLLSIHKHADILNLLYEPQICQVSDFFHRHDGVYFCHVMQTLYWYFTLSCHAWMFCEALNLHHQLVTSVFGGSIDLSPYSWLEKWKKVNAIVGCVTGGFALPVMGTTPPARNLTFRRFLTHFFPLHSRLGATCRSNSTLVHFD